MKDPDFVEDGMTWARHVLAFNSKFPTLEQLLEVAKEEARSPNPVPMSSNQEAFFLTGVVAYYTDKLDKGEPE